MFLLLARKTTRLNQDLLDDPETCERYMEFLQDLGGAK